MTKRLTQKEVQDYIESFGYQLHSEYVSSSKHIKVSCEKEHLYDVKLSNFKIKF